MQWQVSIDGGATFTNISGATSTTYSFTATAADNGDEYQAVFTNSVGNVTTSAATLTVDAVTTQPANTSVNVGQAPRLLPSVPTPAARTPCSWQVSTDGGATFNNISGATSTTYSFTATSAETGDEYRAVFSNTAGTFNSTAATLTVDYVTIQPANQTVSVGQNVAFSAASSNPSGTDTVQWQVSTDGGTTFTDITGATSTTYSFTATSAENGNEYQAVFTNTRGQLHQQRGHAGDRGGGAGRDHPARLRDGGRRQHGDLYRGGQRCARSHRAVGGEHRRRDDLHRHHRRHLAHVQLHGHHWR